VAPLQAVLLECVSVAVCWLFIVITPAMTLPNEILFCPITTEIA
jgi:hypothetical protein